MQLSACPEFACLARQFLPGCTHLPKCECMCSCCRRQRRLAKLVQIEPNFFGVILLTWDPATGWFAVRLIHMVIRLYLLFCRAAGTGFSSWGSVSALTSLTLTGCSGLTDSGLAALAAALGPQLHELALPGCRGLTDEGVGALEVATNLRTLNLSSNRGLSGRYVPCVLVGSLCLHNIGA